MSEIKTGTVYGLYHSGEPDRIRYVGRTIQRPASRLSAHRRDARNPKNQNPVHRWVRKHPDEVRMRILSRHEGVGEVNTAEIKAIREHRERGEADLNLLDGGQGTLGQRWTPEIRERRLQTTPRGEGHYGSKLTHEAVKQIREERQRNWRSSESIAREWGMSPASIREMLDNETWFDPDYDPSKLVRWSPTGSRAPNSRMTWDRVNDLRDRARRELKSSRQWAREFEMSQANVRDILNNKTWFDPDYDPGEVLRNPRNGK